MRLAHALWTTPLAFVLLAPRDAAPPPLPPFPLDPSVHGAAVAGVGDCDLDGSSDVLVGAWWDLGGRGHGSATVVSGKTGEVLHQVRGDEEDAMFAFAVGSAGDVDNDSVADFVVGAPLAARRGKAVGMVRVYSGRDGSVLAEYFGDDEGELFGYAVRSAGDVDQDSFADLVVGAPGARQKDEVVGAARVFSSRKGKLAYEWFGDADGDLFGAAVDSAGDIDMDGKSDVVVGAWGGEYVRVYQGRKGKVLHELRPDVRGGRFGFRVAGAGDANQDGRDDLVIATPRGEPLAALLYSGHKKAEVLHQVTRETTEGAEGWGLGAEVGGAGDVDGDGSTDFLVADPGFPATLSDAWGQPLNTLLARVRKDVARPGRVLVIDGKKGEVLHTFEGTQPDDFFGGSVDGAGDLNQDGFADIVIGAGRGAPFLARVYDGKSGEVRIELELE